MKKELILRPLLQEDVAVFERWLHLPHVAKWYHDPQDWMLEIQNREEEFSWIHHLIAETDGKPIGFCQYYEYACSGETWHKNRNIDHIWSIDYMIGDPSYIGCGYGKEMLQKLIQIVKQQTQADGIIALPESENIPSCRTLCSCGFRYDEVHEHYVLELNT